MKPTSIYDFDFEELVEECFKHKLAPPYEFIHVRKNSEWDRKGIDFVLKTGDETINLQVKASRDKTLALVLPLTEESKLCLSPRMRTRVREHFRKHSDVPYFLFVAHISEEKTRDTIIEEIWRETINLIQCLATKKEGYKLAV